MFIGAWKKICGSCTKWFPVQLSNFAAKLNCLIWLIMGPGWLISNIWGLWSRFNNFLTFCPKKIFLPDFEYKSGFSEKIVNLPLNFFEIGHMCDQGVKMTEILSFFEFRMSTLKILKTASSRAKKPNFGTLILRFFRFLALEDAIFKVFKNVVRNSKKESIQTFWHSGQTCG